MNLYTVTVDGEKRHVLATRADVAAHRAVPSSTSLYAHYVVTIHCEGRAPLCEHARPIVPGHPNDSCWRCAKASREAARAALEA